MSGKMSISGEPLKDTSMHVHRLQSSTLQEYLVFELKVKDFSSRKYNLEYYKPVPNYNMDVHLVRKRRSVIISFSASCYDHVAECFVNYGIGVYSSSVYPQKRTKTLCEVEFPIGLYDTPRNRFMVKSGLLSIVAKCKPIPRLVSRVRPSLNPKSSADNTTVTRPLADSKTDQDHLTDHLEMFVMKKCLADFFIKTQEDGDYVFYLQKGIMACRSKFFFDYINANETKNSITLNDVSVDAIMTVLCFIYHGSIYTPDIDFCTMLEVLELAHRFQIESLAKLCTVYFMDIVDVHNVLQIEPVAIKLELEDLVNACSSIYETAQSNDCQIN